MIASNRRAAALLAWLVVCAWTAGCSAAQPLAEATSASAAASSSTQVSPSADLSASGEPTSVASPSEATPSAAPKPTNAPPDEPTRTPTPTPPPTPVPTPRPSLALLVGPYEPGGPWGMYITSGDQVDADVKLESVSITLSSCHLTHKVVPDAPGSHASTVNLTPKRTQSVALIDGLHTFTATCPSSAGTLTSRNIIQAMDRRPEKCLGFDFAASKITVSSLEELNDGIIGTWQGCVTNPWVPTYWVTMTFRADGTYSAVSTEVLDGQEMIAMYYGMDEDSPAKKYELNDLQANLKGVGDIDVVFDQGSVNRDDLRNVALMGDKLQFDYVHAGVYGPLTFRLHRS